MTKWPYGIMMNKQGDIDSLDEWSDDLEVACSIMDERFDYLWEKDGNRMIFTDRLYSDGITDEEVVRKRIAHGEAKMVFDSFEDVFRWILSKDEKDLPYYDWMVKRIGKRIWRSYAELDHGNKKVELLWDDEREAENYFYSLSDYKRCNYVAVFTMESQPDHVIKDVGCIFENGRRINYEN